MDLHEDAENNVVTATFDLPGLTKDKVHIDLQNGNLTISGEVVESAEKTSQVYAIRERESGQFSRSVKLPEGTKVGNEGFICSFGKSHLHVLLF